MHAKTLKFLFTVSLVLVLTGLYRLILGEGDTGLSLLVMGLSCSFVLLLADQRMPISATKPASSNQAPA